MSNPEIPPGHLKMRPAVEVGPEFEDSGDPQWIQPEYAAGGALPGDGYLSYGRWRERIPPTATHPADLNPRTMCRAGLRQALRRLSEAMSLPHSTVAAAGPVDDDPTVRAIIATYDALEWVHTFNEYARAALLYRNATDLDPVNGSFVEGSIGARNASHHGMRRVIGIVEVKRPYYTATADRWEHTGTYRDDEPDSQVRWVATLPGPALTYPAQTLAFDSHLAGREVRNTFNSIYSFFFFTLEGLPVPDGLMFGPASLPPYIDTSLRISGD